ncbi:hypothetical protein SAMD00023353_4000220 [Rosellinia necatrix]|uniref:Uncharacterized protein n=1 Tax=Rosellinia necatrix TaxID=77044 RepID=A0A1W2TM49_ROSNE|nr:hypothetical protein SAMD00023353_4000220 [Rosellinia necatrix]
MGAIRVGGGMKTSQTYSNLPMPASLYITPSSKPSVVTAHTTARAIPGRNSENIPPSVSMANIGATKQSASDYATRLQPPQPLLSKKKEKSRLGIPKTRTLNVFSNLTASLSRASLGQLASGDLRRTSGSSKGTAHKDSMPYMNSQSAASTSSSQVLLSPTAEATDQQQIHTAQSSAYWTGRFMALQDHFQSETLRPENLTTLVHAHAERSLLPVAQPSNLTSSATTSCLPQAAKPLTIISMSPPKVQQQPKHQQQQQQQQQRIPRVGTTAYKASRPMTTAAPARPSYEAAAALLLDEDSRARRIFSHLDFLCTTSDARNSLRRWQQDYARRVGKESLLPEGGTMRGRNRELTWVGRLLIGSSGHSKRGSLGL